MFETETVEPCLVRKLKVDGGGGGAAWLPCPRPSDCAPAYDKSFPKTKVKVKFKSDESP